MPTGSDTYSIPAPTIEKPEIAIGVGCTMVAWTDRHAGTIVKVTPTQIHVQADTATRTDKNGMSDNQDYYYTRNLMAPVYIFRKTKRGWRCKQNSCGLCIGVRRAYHDYSF